MQTRRKPAHAEVKNTSKPAEKRTQSRVSMRQKPKNPNPTRATSTRNVPQQPQAASVKSNKQKNDSIGKNDKQQQMQLTQMLPTASKRIGGKRVQSGAVKEKAGKQSDQSRSNDRGTSRRSNRYRESSEHDIKPKIGVKNSVKVTDFVAKIEDQSQKRKNSQSSHKDNNKIIPKKPTKKRLREDFEANKSNQDAEDYSKYMEKDCDDEQENKMCGKSKKKQKDQRNKQDQSMIVDKEVVNGKGNAKNQQHKRIKRNAKPAQANPKDTNFIATKKDDDDMIEIKKVNARPLKLSEQATGIKSDQEMMETLPELIDTITAQKRSRGRPPVNTKPLTQQAKSKATSTKIKGYPVLKSSDRDDLLDSLLQIPSHIPGKSQRSQSKKQNKTKNKNLLLGSTKIDSCASSSSYKRQSSVDASHPSLVARQEVNINDKKLLRAMRLDTNPVTLIKTTVVYPTVEMKNKACYLKLNNQDSPDCEEDERFSFLSQEIQSHSQLSQGDYRQQQQSSLSQDNSAQVPVTSNYWALHSREERKKFDLIVKRRKDQIKSTLMDDCEALLPIFRLYETFKKQADIGKKLLWNKAPEDQIQNVENNLHPNHNQ
eukprot:403333709